MLLLSHWMYHISHWELLNYVSLHPVVYGASSFVLFFIILQPHLQNLAFYFKLMSASFFHTFPAAILFRLPRYYSVDEAQRYKRKENCLPGPVYEPVPSFLHNDIFSVKIFESSTDMLPAFLSFISILIYPGKLNEIGLPVMLSS